MAANAIARRPLSVLWQVMRAEKPVDPREMDGEINIDRFLLDAVMPVMETRRHHEGRKPLVIEAQIGMDIGRNEIDEEDIGIERALAETEKVHGNNGEAAQ